MLAAGPMHDPVPPTATEPSPKPQSTKPPFPTPPQIIHDSKRGKQYTRGALLGEGGFARCYEVYESSGARLAAKVIPKISLKSQKQKAKVCAFKLNQTAL